MKFDEARESGGASPAPARISKKNGKLKRKAYEKALTRLHAELVKLQEWVVSEGLRVCIVFEGRDGAGKGGTIKAITDRVSPRVFRVIALPARTEREKSQMYVQRYRQAAALGSVGPTGTAERPQQQQQAGGAESPVVGRHRPDPVPVPGHELRREARQPEG